MKKIHARYFLVALGLLGSCKTSNQKDPNQAASSGLYEISTPADGKVLAKDEAISELKTRQDSLNDHIKDVFSRGQMFYNGGYDSLADSSATRFKTGCGTMVDSEFGCFRTTEGEWLGSQGQDPPSKDARLNDLITLMYQVSMNSLVQDGSQSGYYSQIEVRTGVNFSGQIAGQTVSKSNCLSVEGKDDQYRMSFLFYDCGDSFYGRSARKGSLAALRNYWGIEKM